MKYTYDNKYFKKPNISNCYLAGILASDGCIFREKNIVRCQIVFKYSDLNFLEMVKNEISFSGKIHKNYNILNGKKFYRASIRIGNIINDWYLDLKKHWNITERKSLTLQPPNITKLEHKLAYIIGYIDGDGSISITNSRANKPILQLAIEGNNNILNWMSKELYLLEDTKYKLQIPSKRSSCNSSNLVYHNLRGYNLLKILNTINVPFKMIRKWDNISKYEQMIDNYQHKCKRWTLEEENLIIKYYNNNKLLLREKLPHRTWIAIKSKARKIIC